MNAFKKNLLLIASYLMVSSAVFAQSDTKTVVIIFDGLRPEYITAQLMPHLYQLKQQSSYANNNHSVFPTVTRVNSASYATGSYPYRHGILGNSIHVPALGNDKVYNTGERSNLLIVDSLSGNELLTATSVGEVLADNGKQLYVFSSGSSGQAFLQNHKVNGAIIHPEFILPESFGPVVKAALGGIKPKAEDSYAKHTWITDAFLHFGLVSDGPAVSSVWYSEPDAAQHVTGIGSPKSLAAAKTMDEQLGRILETMKQRNLTGNVNLIVTSDHGFITYEGDHTVRDFLVAEGFKKDIDSDDIIIADGALFVKNHDATVIANIVARLQQQTWVGPIFTAAKAKGSSSGTIAGTLSFETIYWHHADRAADILVTYDWNDDTNEYGYKGIAVNKSSIAAGHGGISAHEIKTFMVLNGPAFKPGYISELPSSFIDIAPTVLALNGIGGSNGMDGRILREFLVSTGNEALPSAKREVVSEKVNGQWGQYEVEVHLSTVDGYRYVDFGKVKRTAVE